jgi:hypothetical protein
MPTRQCNIGDCEKALSAFVVTQLLTGVLSDTESSTRLTANDADMIGVV